MVRKSAAANTCGIFASALVPYLLPVLLLGTANASEDFCKAKPRSAVLLAVNARNRAFAETSARIPTRSDGAIVDVPCTNTSKLFVSASGGNSDLTFMQSPSPDRPGSDLELIDWSPSGQYLLADLFTYQYEGEGAEHSPLVYDADSGLVYQPNLFEVFKNHFHHECSVNSSIMGFTPDGRLVIKAGPLAQDATYEPTLPASCVKKASFFALNFRKGDLQPLADHYQVQKYSTSGKD